jgi:hypothetical protein
MLTAEEQDIECLVRLKDHQVWPKHNSSRLLLVVVDLHSRVARTTIGHYTRLVPVLLVQEREGGGEDILVNFGNIILHVHAHVLLTLYIGSMDPSK